MIISLCRATCVSSGQQFVNEMQMDGNRAGCAKCDEGDKYSHNNFCHDPWRTSYDFEQFGKQQLFPMENLLMALRSERSEVCFEFMIIFIRLNGNDFCMQVSLISFAVFGQMIITAPYIVARCLLFNETINAAIYYSRWWIEEAAYHERAHARAMETMQSRQRNCTHGPSHSQTKSVPYVYDLPAWEITIKLCYNIFLK